MTDEIHVKIAERLPEPLEARAYYIEKVEYVRFPGGLEGWRVTLKAAESGKLYQTTLWKREIVGGKSKLGAFLLAFKQYFNDSVKARNVQQWIGKVVMLERWQPKNRLVKVVETQRTEQQSSQEDCKKALVEKLERGKVYSIKDILASGIGFPENIIEETLDLLVHEGKAFEIPTSPKKWFYEG
jgi:hypothetical protein